MYSIHIDEMVKKIMAIDDPAVDEPICRALPEAEIRQAIEDCWKDKVAITWSIEDVKSAIFQETNQYITDEQAKEVLDAVVRNHDASMGVNWETLRVAVDDMLGKEKADANLD